MATGEKENDSEGLTRRAGNSTNFDKERGW